MSLFTGKPLLWKRNGGPRDVREVGKTSRGTPPEGRRWGRMVSSDTVVAGTETTNS